MRLALLICVAVFVGGCGLKYRPRHDPVATRLGALIGKDVAHLVSQMGPPTQVYPNGETTIYLWGEAGDTVVNSMGYASGLGGGALASGRSVISQRSCTTWFDVDADGIVRTWRYKGRC